MIRATTPTHKFTVPFDPEEMQELLLTYSQLGRRILERRKEELTFSEEDEEHIISHLLGQVETARFRPGAPVQIQLRALTAAGEAMASQIVTARVEDVLNDEVLE